MKQTGKTYVLVYKTVLLAGTILTSMINFRVTGSNKGISNLPINLRVYSPHVLNITLIGK